MDFKRKNTIRHILSSLFFSLVMRDPKECTKTSYKFGSSDHISKLSDFWSWILTTSFDSWYQELVSTISRTVRTTSFDPWYQELVSPQRLPDAERAVAEQSEYSRSVTFRPASGIRLVRRAQDYIVWTWEKIYCPLLFDCLWCPLEETLVEDIGTKTPKDKNASGHKLRIKMMKKWFREIPGGRFFESTNTSNIWIQFISKFQFVTVIGAKRWL